MQPPTGKRWLAAIAALNVSTKLSVSFIKASDLLLTYWAANFFV
jgi:DNA replication protein DnaC